MTCFLTGTGKILLYFAIAAGTALTCRVLIRIPDELFRKILHCIVLGSLPVFLTAFAVWWMAAVEAIAFALAVFPLLVILERIPGFSRLTTERKHGELKNSLLLVFFMYALVIGICWGWLKDRYLVLASIYAWGFGDAAAALVGKRYGHHKIPWKCSDGKKSFEGSGAMLAVSLVTVLVILSLRGGMTPAGLIITAVIVAMAATMAELCSKNGNDTVICPLSAMAVLLPLIELFGGVV